MCANLLYWETKSEYSSAHVTVERNIPLNSNVMTDLTIADKVAGIRRRIRAAASRAGRNPDEVTLLAVTKTVEPSRIAEAYGAGVRDFGENYVQEAVNKRLDNRIEHPDIRWHFIGHVQSNKVKDVIDRFTVIQSVDSIALAREIGRRATGTHRAVEILLQVKLDSIPTKFGIAAAEILPMAEMLVDIPGIAVAGLMGMAPFAEEPEQSRSYFRALRELFERLPPASRQILSMGMTGDFDVAVEEGATLVRIGTAIFGSRAEP
jgi:pyridoxal phosphate enzyme (YggS family)